MLHAPLIFRAENSIETCWTPPRCTQGATIPCAVAVLALRTSRERQAVRAGPWPQRPLCSLLRTWPWMKPLEVPSRSSFKIFRPSTTWFVSCGWLWLIRIRSSNRSWFNMLCPWVHGWFMLPLGGRGSATERHHVAPCGTSQLLPIASSAKVQIGTGRTNIEAFEWTIAYDIAIVTTTVWLQNMLRINHCTKNDLTCAMCACQSTNSAYMCLQISTSWVLPTTQFTKCKHPSNSIDKMTRCIMHTYISIRVWFCMPLNAYTILVTNTYHMIMGVNVCVYVNINK